MNDDDCFVGIRLCCRGIRRGGRPGHCCDIPVAGVGLAGARLLVDACSLELCTISRCWRCRFRLEKFVGGSMFLPLATASAIRGRRRR